MKKAFTLIELLIVVAIIAILAAIAVPNFLEAQTRSKIARVNSDQRSLTVAIESYTVDYNRPPIGCNEGRGPPLDLWPDGANGHSYLYGQGPYIYLTTPVAYTSTIPIDSFSMRDNSVNNVEYEHFPLNVYHRKHENLSPALKKVLGSGFTFAMRSIGPSRINAGPWVGAMLNPGYNPGNNGGYNVYDATNGTKSKGFIIRTNKGFFTGK